MQSKLIVIFFNMGLKKKKKSNDLILESILQIGMLRMSSTSE